MYIYRPDLIDNIITLHLENVFLCESLQAWYHTTPHIASANASAHDTTPHHTTPLHTTWNIILLHAWPVIVRICLFTKSYQHNAWIWLPHNVDPQIVLGTWTGWCDMGEVCGQHDVHIPWWYAVRWPTTLHKNPDPLIGGMWVLEVNGNDVLLVFKCNFDASLPEYLCTPTCIYWCLYINIFIYIYIYMNLDISPIMLISMHKKQITNYMLHTRCQAPRSFH